jgi:hypothetical protein
MKLKMESVDSNTPRGRLRRALAQVKEERRHCLSMLEREKNNSVRQIEGVNPKEAALFGSMGPQVKVDVLNGLGGALYAYDQVIELLEDLLKKRTTIEDG